MHVFAYQIFYCDKTYKVPLPGIAKYQTECSDIKKRMKKNIKNAIYH